MTEGLHSLNQRMTVALVLVGIYLVTCVAVLGVYGAAMVRMIDLQALPTQSVVDVINSLLYGNIGLFFLSALAVSFWIHRAHQNLHDAGAEGLEFTPGWSIGWFFVPIASLYMPYKAMRELWHVSMGEGPDLSGPAPWQLMLWWGCFLLGNFTGYGAELEGIAALGTVAHLVSATMLAIVMFSITRAQRSSLEVWSTFA